MKKSVKILLIALSAVALVIIVLVLTVSLGGIPHYEVDAPDLTVELTEARVTEGARIASVLCIQCHGSTDGKMGGAYMPDARVFGNIHASNITRHPELGITDYSDGELAFLLRTGIKRDGQFIPYMPLFPNLSDEDLFSIIAFLRSDHPTVLPSDHQPPPSEPSFLAKLLTRIAIKPLPYPEEEIVAPPPTDRVAYGRYLAVGKFDCFACHSASFTKLDMLNPENSEGYFGGGNVLVDTELNEVISSNLTMDEETGLGTWTEAEFIKALRFGRKPDNTAIRPPMMPSPMITEDEAGAIWAYLQTIPVIHNPEDE